MRVAPLAGEKRTYNTREMFFLLFWNEQSQSKKEEKTFHAGHGTTRPHSQQGDRCCVCRGAPFFSLRLFSFSSKEWAREKLRVIISIIFVCSKVQWYLLSKGAIIFKLFGPGLAIPRTRALLGCLEKFYLQGIFKREREKNVYWNDKYCWDDNLNSLALYARLITFHVKRQKTKRSKRSIVEFFIFPLTAPNGTFFTNCVFV